MGFFNREVPDAVVDEVASKEPLGWVGAGAINLRDVGGREPADAGEVGRVDNLWAPLGGLGNALRLTNGRTSFPEEVGISDEIESRLPSSSIGNLEHDVLDVDLPPPFDLAVAVGNCEPDEVRLFDDVLGGANGADLGESIAEAGLREEEEDEEEDNEEIDEVVNDGDFFLRLFLVLFCGIGGKAAFGGLVNGARGI